MVNAGQTGEPKVSRGGAARYARGGEEKLRTGSRIGVDPINGVTNERVFAPMGRTSYWVNLARADFMKEGRSVVNLPDRARAVLAGGKGRPSWAARGWGGYCVTGTNGVRFNWREESR
jgi:hypothetical protein